MTNEEKLNEKAVLMDKTADYLLNEIVIITGVPKPDYDKTDTAKKILIDIIENWIEQSKLISRIDEIMGNAAEETYKEVPVSKFQPDVKKRMTDFFEDIEWEKE